jgi:hypothetical protein
LNRCVAAIIDGRAKIPQLSRIFNIPKSTLQDNVRRVEYQIQKRMKIRENMKQFELQVQKTIKIEKEED